MEIRLKTAEEFRSAHVTIEIRATPEEATQVSERLFTAAEVGDAQASEAELVAAPLRRRVAKLEAENADADRRITALSGQVQGYDHDRHTERDRADKAEDALIKTRADREEAERKVRELERRNSELVIKLEKSEKDRDLRLEELEAAEVYQAERAAEARRSLAARDHLLSAATTRINAVREILLATAVSRARDEIVTSKGAVLADAIGNALHALEG